MYVIFDMLVTPQLNVAIGMGTTWGNMSEFVWKPVTGKVLTGNGLEEKDNDTNIWSPAGYEQYRESYC